MNRKSLFLVGPMGAGKTTVGKKLAETCNLDFVDSDHEIEVRTGVDISYIFEKEGEEGFRRREQAVIDDLTTRGGIVLATGGGAVLLPENRAHLSARGLVVYLHASLEQQLARTERSEHRPLLMNGDRRETLIRLFEHRDPLYREVADLVVETDGKNARQLAREIQDALLTPPGEQA
ncbi:MAG: shikimate kinase AroK [Nevskiaceae bacterium]|nr:MAG: shikimate kinase AroK [Nevskiaceae bacterium]TAM24717.1 MAG: shikimate kinase AroK [Nevskiaceae bacterium]